MKKSCLNTGLLKIVIGCLFTLLFFSYHAGNVKAADDNGRVAFYITLEQLQASLEAPSPLPIPSPSPPKSEVNYGEVKTGDNTQKSHLLFNCIMIGTVGFLFCVGERKWRSQQE